MLQQFNPFWNTQVARQTKNQWRVNHLVGPPPRNAPLSKQQALSQLIAFTLLLHQVPLLNAMMTIKTRTRTMMMIWITSFLFHLFPLPVNRLKPSEMSLILWLVFLHPLVQLRLYSTVWKSSSKLELTTMHMTSKASIHSDSPFSMHLCQLTLA